MGWLLFNNLGANLTKHYHGMLVVEILLKFNLQEQKTSKRIFASPQI